MKNKKTNKHKKNISSKFSSGDFLDEEFDYEPNNFYIKKQKVKKPKQKKAKSVQKVSQNTVEGVISGSGKGFMFCRVNGMPDFFIPPQKTKGAIDGDRVLIKIISNTEESTEAHVVKILKRANTILVGELVKFKNEYYFKCDNKKIDRQIKIEKRHTFGAKLGEKVVCKLTYQPENIKEKFQGEIIEILGDANSKEVLELSILREHQIYETFPKDVIEECDKIAEKGIVPEDKKGRVDLTNEEIFTIDGEDAKDFDDAISLKILPNNNYYLGVHIADVGHYVKRGSKTDKEAFMRGTSVYFPTMTFPMLPESFSNGLCSLKEDEERLTLSVFMEIDNKGNVLNHKIQESFIKSKSRLTYTDVYKVLSGQGEPEKAHKHKETLLKMNELAKILKNRREMLGELDFDLSEPFFVLDEKNEVIEVKKRERNDAHKLIESFMIVCNEVVAKHFYDLKVPFAYRVHEIPTKEKLENVLAFLKGLNINVPQPPKNIVPSYYAQLLELVKNHPISETINKVILRSLQKARYLGECLGHFGLASPYYCHFTSPIRRYPDLVIHRIIKNYLKTKTYEKDLEEFVFEACEQSSLKERSADEAEREVDDLKKAEYMKKHIGEEFEGVISGVNNFGFFVELDNTVEGLVKIETLPKDDYLFFEKSLKLKGQNHTYSIGDKVKVKVVASNIFERRVEFVLA